MSASGGLFAVNNGSFNLERLIGHFNEQYREYLQKSGGALLVIDGSDHAPDVAVLHGVNDEEHQYPGFKIVLDNPVLLDHLFDFLDSRRVAIQKSYKPEDHYHALIISKQSLEDVGLTYKDEGDYLFLLNKKFKGLLAQHEAMRQERLDEGRTEQAAIEGMRL